MTWPKHTAKKDADDSLRRSLQQVEERQELLFVQVATLTQQIEQLNSNLELIRDHLNSPTKAQSPIIEVLN